MITKIVLPSLLIILFLFIGCINTFSASQPQNTDCKPPMLPSREYEQLARDVADEHEYTKDYVCDNFSRDLALRLKENNWFAWREVIEAPLEDCLNSAETYGFDYDSDTCFHAITFVAVPIEATTGRIITPKDWEKRGLKLIDEQAPTFYPCNYCMMNPGGYEDG